MEENKENLENPENKENPENLENQVNWYCYILRSTNPLYPKLTYNGSTNDMRRRLRQHNGEIKGGAKATSGKGPWEPYAILTGFKTHSEALSCEWRIKHPTNQRKRPSKYNGINGRVSAFNLILNLDNWTLPCKELNTGLCTGNMYTLYLDSSVFDIVNSKNIKPNVLIKNISELVS